MKTIEQCEAEFARKSEIVSKQLEVFQENIGQIGSIINKDASSVYKTLLTQYNSVVSMYNASLTRNVSVLSTYIAKLDRIQVVLDEVMLSIDKIETVPDDDTLTLRFDVNDTMEKASEKASEIADEIVEGTQEKVEEVTGKEIPKWAVWAGAGLILYWILK